MIKGLSQYALILSHSGYYFFYIKSSIKGRRKGDIMIKSICIDIKPFWLFFLYKIKAGVNNKNPAKKENNKKSK